MNAKPYTPHPYQLRAIQTLAAKSGSGLFLDPGMGKTSITLAAFTVLRDAKAVTRMLVIAPLRPARLVWPQEVAKWIDFAQLRVSLIVGSAKQREAAMRADADVYVVNCDNTEWLFKNWPAFGDRAPDMLVVDESTRFKNPSSVRFKALRDNLAKFKRRTILTGTPAPQSIEDLFAQAFIMDGGAALGAYITRFRREFCFAENIHVGGGRVIQKWHPKKDAAERIYERLNGNVLHLAATDYLTMPKLIANRVEVELPVALRSKYRALERDLFLATEGGNTLSPANAAACVMKLRQMVNGVAYAVDGQQNTVSEAMHTEKLDALAELVEEASGEPVLIAVSFVHEVAAIREILGDKNIPYLGGGVSAREADRIVADWNAGKLPVLLAHPASVAHGLNLQAGGHTLVWFGLTWNQEEHQQMIARVYRQGQDKPVVVHYIVAKDTVDDTILDALQAKTSAQAAILNKLKGAK